MKRAAIGIGALLLCGAAVVLRPSERVIVRERIVEVPVPAPASVPPAAIPDVALPETPAAIPPAPAVRRAAAPALAPMPAGVARAHDRMLFLFQRELGLQAVQRAHFARALRDREAEIRRVQDAVRASKVFDVKSYTRRIRSLQLDSYDRMAAVLDVTQTRRFHDLLAEGRIGDAVQFDVDDDIVVLE